MSEKSELMKKAKGIARYWDMPEPRSDKQAAMFLCGIEIGRSQMRKSVLNLLVGRGGDLARWVIRIEKMQSKQKTSAETEA